VLSLCIYREKVVALNHEVITGHGFEVARLGDDPSLQKFLGIFGKFQHEFSLTFQLVNRLHRLVDLRVQRRNFLLARRGQEEVVHLRFETVIDLNVDVVTSSLPIVWTIDGNEMVDDNWIWRMKKRMKSLGNIGELHLEAVEDLRQISIAINEFSLVGIL